MTCLDMTQTEFDLLETLIRVYDEARSHNPNPNPERAAGHRFYWETDAVACYSQFVLAPGRSREALAVWSPIGLVQPTTLPFGQRNSGTEAQGPYRAAANEMNVGRHGSYVDDWIGYSNDLEQLFSDFAMFLQVCRKYRITLGPPKTRFGYPESQFFGFHVNEQGSHLAVKLT
jgi:hypothetical protein